MEDGVAQQLLRLDNIVSLQVKVCEIVDRLNVTWPAFDGLVKGSYRSIWLVCIKVCIAEIEPSFCPVGTKTNRSLKSRNSIVHEYDFGTHGIDRATVF